MLLTLVIIIVAFVVIMASTTLIVKICYPVKKDDDVFLRMSSTQVSNKPPTP